MSKWADHSSVTDHTRLPENAVAVVGMACRLPHAANPHEFWELLRNGGDAITDKPATRQALEGGAPSDGSVDGGVPVRRGGFLDDVDAFDAGFFGIPPGEAAAMDPQQRLMLELHWEALEAAGIRPDDLRESSTGVFVGVASDDYATLMARSDGTAVSSHSATGSHRGMIANRVSYVLGFKGPSLTVDTAQSSSLVAVHLAVESLRREECAIALAGGVKLDLAPESLAVLDGLGALSPDGRCYTFDARANGFVRGEGGGVVVLKPLERAIEDGDQIHCVIRGTAMNNDGTGDGTGLTVPSRDGQITVLRRALDASSVRPSDIQYVELHGTGTRIGDPTEAAALGAVIGSERASSGPLRVGSVKTNIGHLEGAAGIAGLLKVALSISHRQLVPSLNFETPNPEIPLDEWNLQVQHSTEDWPRADTPLIAGVSSFGMGGTNCHVLMSDWTAVQPSDELESGSRVSVAGGLVPWVVSGRSAAGLRA
ncbi:polyketide synthase, partial [Streptomyces sioyaensis]|uniref:polyketide synthase n=1 Tax=Streptomyces sioyaensis TaxID=67364 RepID=UPI0033C8C78A